MSARLAEGTGARCSCRGMDNVLAEDKRRQILALGRLGWSLRRTERATGVRRETVSQDLRAAGVMVRGRGRPPAHPANRAFRRRCPPTLRGPVGRHGHGSGRGRVRGPPRPRTGGERLRALPRVDRRGPRPRPQRHGHPAGPGRRHDFPAGYASVRRFVSALQQQSTAEARAVITTARGRQATATGRWSVTPTPASTGGRGSSS